MNHGNQISSFKDRFSILFSESGKTIKELSSDLHVSYQTISAWKLGTRAPKLPTIISVANYFTVSVQWLMGYDVDREDADIPPLYERSEDLSAPAKALINGITILTEEQQRQLLAVARAMFPLYTDYFEEGAE